MMERLFGDSGACDCGNPLNEGQTACDACDFAEKYGKPAGEIGAADVGGGILGYPQDPITEAQAMAKTEAGK